jgi:hypothetical protein
MGGSYLVYSMVTNQESQNIAIEIQSSSWLHEITLLKLYFIEVVSTNSTVGYMEVMLNRY